MVDINKAAENQLKNIQERTGKNLEELYNMYKSSGLKKHGEVRTFFINEVGMGYGDATNLAYYLMNSGGDLTGTIVEANLDTAIDGIYAGAKEALRPVHEAIMQKINSLGEFDITPKKSYLSLRRKRQFAMVGPATNSRIEVGLNMKGISPTDRLEQNPPGGMCQYKVKVTSLGDVDDELVGWIKTAYDSAG